MTGPAHSPRGDGESGVTLVEVLVALAVVALTLAMAAGGLQLLARSGDRGAQLVARHDTLSRGIDVLRRDVERLERVIVPSDGDAGLVFHGDATSLRLVVIEPPFPTEPGPYLVSYAILARGDGAVLTRERVPFQAAADVRPGAEGTQEPEDSVVVIDGAYDLRFRYFDRNEGGRWLPRWSDPRRLPDLIGLELSDVGGERMPRIVFRPRIDAEVGCIVDGGGPCTIGIRGAPASQGAAGPGGGN